MLTRETADGSEAWLTEAEAVLRGIPPTKWLALTLIRQGDLRLRQVDHARVLADYRECFAWSRTSEFWIGLGKGGSNMAELLYATWETERALPSSATCAKNCRRAGGRR